MTIIRSFEMRLIDSNHITVTFLFRDGSKESREWTARKRVERKSSEHENDDSRRS
jgi:hypothetical protein